MHGSINHSPVPSNIKVMQSNHPQRRQNQQINVNSGWTFDPDHAGHPSGLSIPAV
jgi:hypothetical protein